MLFQVAGWEGGARRERGQLLHRNQKPLDLTHARTELDNGRIRFKPGHRVGFFTTDLEPVVKVWRFYLPIPSSTPLQF